MVDSITIRNATIEDIPNIHSVIDRVWPQTYSSIISKEQIEYMLDMMYSNESLIRQMTEERCTFLLAFINEQPVGLASFSEIENEVFKLHKLYVDLTVQNMGIGKMLLHQCEARVSAHGAKKFLLNVNRYNPSVQFYLKQGYSKLKEADVHIGNGYYMNDYILEKRLVG